MITDNGHTGVACSAVLNDQRLTKIMSHFSTPLYNLLHSSKELLKTVIFINSDSTEWDVLKEAVNHVNCDMSDIRFLYQQQEENVLPERLMTPPDYVFINGKATGMKAMQYLLFIRKNPAFDGTSVVLYSSLPETLHQGINAYGTTTPSA